MTITGAARDPVRQNAGCYQKELSLATRRIVFTVAPAITASLIVARMGQAATVATPGSPSFRE
jgi:hypothetical protein